ncbi:MAG: LCP family protein [Treponema sp.]|nr:LCP family protein [Treponema sp.]
MRKIRDEQKGIIFLVVMFLILAGASVFFALSLRTDNVAESLDEDQVVRELFIFEKDDGSVLFSSVMVYYPVTAKAAIVNVPSNTGAIYQSLGRVDAIEEVYKEAGVEAFRNEVGKLLGMSSIPFYAVIKVSDFCKITDLLGGLRVFVPSPVDFTDEEGKRILLPSGAVNLDGQKIITYLTYHLPEDEESDEQERYQNVMAAFFTSLHEKKYLILNPKHFGKYTADIKTNLDSDDSFTLYKMICNIDSDSIVKQTITGTQRMNEGKLLLYPRENGEFIKTAVQQSTNMLTTKGGIQTSRIYVLEIQNGTSEDGLARRTAERFRNASYDVLSPVNADKLYNNTVIIDHIGNHEIAMMVGEFIQCTNIQEAEIKTEEEFESNTANVDFTVILGKDFNGRYVVPNSR